MMSLIIELPQPKADQPISQFSDTFSRLMALADVAKDVHIIAPRSNSYRKQWEDYIKRCRYRNTVHNWCGMDIRDTDSGRPVGASHPHRLHSATLHAQMSMREAQIPRALIESYKEP